MWSQADDALRRRDPQLGHLRQVLDAGHAAELLTAALPAFGITNVEPEYVRYKPQTSCLVNYRISGAVGTTWAYLQAWSDEAADKAEKLRRLPEKLDADAPPPVDAAPGVMLACFPWDRRLSAVRDLATQEAQQQLLGALLPGWNAGELGLHGLRYKPERRYVARIDSAHGPVAMLKCYDDASFDRAVGGARAVDRDPTFVTAALAGVARRRRVIVSEWLSGEGLDAMLTDGRDHPRLYAEVGAHLADLHASDPLGWPRRDAYEVPESLHAAARMIGTVLPELASAAQDIADRCVAGLDWRAGTTPVHGDFSVDQVLIDRDEPTLVDFDRATVGLPVEDLGRFVANLHAANVEGLLTPADSEERARAFLDAYTAASSTNLAGLEVATAAALLQLAQEPFRRRATNWAEQTERLVELAAKTVAWTKLPADRNFRPRNAQPVGGRPE